MKDFFIKIIYDEGIKISLHKSNQKGEYLKNKFSSWVGHFEFSEDNFNSWLKESTTTTARQQNEKKDGVEKKLVHDENKKFIRK